MKAYWTRFYTKHNSAKIEPGGNYFYCTGEDFNDPPMKTICCLVYTSDDEEDGNRVIRYIERFYPDVKIDFFIEKPYPDWRPGDRFPGIEPLVIR